MEWTIRGSNFALLSSFSIAMQLTNYDLIGGLQNVANFSVRVICTCDLYLSFVRVIYIEGLQYWWYAMFVSFKGIVTIQDFFK